ncbi:MAG TPA: helix-turn-helix domain-containing protein [Acidimicrobiales bacterium]|nr:helix-turn-helix domain-containing protein [Acidimicrobiales bacterium]
MYRERPSRVPGAVVWTSEPTGDLYRVLPDGCMDIIWSTEGTLLVAGPDTTAFLTSGTSGTTLTGIRFAPGFAPILLRLPAHHLRDQRADLDAVVPTRVARQLADRLAASGDPGSVLEDIALDVDASEQVELIAACARDGKAVNLIARDVGLSPRQLQRRCLDAFGYGAKTLARILRMNRALDIVRTGAAYADAAARAGYADQPHLARDVKALAGVPLGQLVPEAAKSSTELPSGSCTAA